MNDAQGGFIKEYDLGGIPAYRKPIIEELIFVADLFVDGYDTPENLDNLAVKLFDIIVDQHLLDAHLRANIPPESHD